MAYKGVNLGGWLVLERWMTPSLFEGSAHKDEIGLASEKHYSKNIEAHYHTFITEADIRWLSRHGITHLRVPVGYWIFGDHPPFIRGIQHLDKLFQWAEKYDMKVLLSIHGAPGSQNGKHHSGKLGDIEWKNHRKSLDEFTLKIVDRYSGRSALWGICLLNEPTDQLGHFRALFGHYRHIVHALRRRTPTLRLFIDATFHPLAWAIAAKILGSGVDMHLYHGFDNADVSIAAKRLHVSNRLIKILKKAVPIVIGEWSGVVHHSGTLKQRQKYIQAQQTVYEQTDAHFYWTYKTESGGVWSFKDFFSRNIN
jgi:glucan 1,3-beta-glucosidase